MSSECLLQARRPHIFPGATAQARFAGELRQERTSPFLYNV
jgi:hypothetical protein